MSEIVDLGEVVLVHDDEDTRPTVWVSPASGVTPSKRLLEAFARGEVTAGGLAEAGWRDMGKMGNLV